MRFPSVRNVTDVLVKEQRSIPWKDVQGEPVDVRLQVFENGQWAIHVGLSDYDTDHRGYWGSASIQKKTTSDKTYSVPLTT